MNILIQIPRLFRRLPGAIWRRILSRPAAVILRYFYGVQFGCKPTFVGWPIFNGSGIVIGNNCVLVSTQLGNPISLFRPCIIGVLDNADGTMGSVRIGDRFAASGVCIWAQKSVIIGNDVMIGANVVIADTDFHSLDSAHRKDGHRVAKAKSIVIEDNVWIGMNAVILKGVTIGRGAIIGANCVVSKNVLAGCTLVSAPHRML